MITDSDKHIISFAKARHLVNNAIDSGDGMLYASRVGFDCDYPVALADDLSVAGFLLSGSMKVTVNTGSFTVNAGEMFVFQPGDIIRDVHCDDNCTGRMLVLTSGRILELVSEVDLYRYLLYLRENPVIVPSTASGDTIATCLRIIDRKLTDRTTGWIRSKTSVLYLLHTLVVEVFEVLNRLDVNITMTRHNVFQRFMEMLGTTAIHHHQVDWYAQRLNVTSKYLSEVCRKCSGRPASTWIRDYCIIDIRRYLSDEKLSVKEVAFLLEYPNLSFFGKCVRRWFGMSPTALRNRLSRTDNIENTADLN